MATETWSPNVESSQLPLYLAIARALEDDIASGQLPTDTKLPTQRELADSLKIALGTVTRAYAEAERRGLIRSEGRRGTYVGEPQTSRSYLSRIADERPGSIDLSKNHPFYQLDPELSDVLKRIARQRTVQELLHYPPAFGLKQHREVGAALFERLGASVEPDAVCLTAGAQHAMSVIIASEAVPGDVIASESFTYPGIKALAEQNGAQLVGVACDDQGMIPEDLDRVCRQRAVRLLYCNPSMNNPTVTTSPMSRREALAEVAQRHNLTVIEDEIMRPMMTEHPGYLWSLIPEQCYLVTSTSKSIAAGLRVGFAVAPEKSRRRMVSGMNASCLGVPPISAEILSKWWHDGTVDRVIENRRKDTAARQSVAAEILEGLEFNGHPCCYHVWLRLPEEWTGLRLASEAQMRGVVVSPAELFAVDNKKRYEAVRLSIVVPPTVEQLRQGLEVVADLVRGSDHRGMATV